MFIILKGFSDRRVWINDRLLTPSKSQKVRNHSPDGFNWGYGGSGPAQLALGILLEYTDQGRALSNYQRFKEDVIATIPNGGDFEIQIDLSPYLNL